MNLDFKLDAKSAFYSVPFDIVEKQIRTGKLQNDVRQMSLSADQWEDDIRALIWKLIEENEYWLQKLEGDQLAIVQYMANIKNILPITPNTLHNVDSSKG